MVQKVVMFRVDPAKKLVKMVGIWLKKRWCFSDVAESPTSGMTMTRKRPPGNAPRPTRKEGGRSKRKKPWGR